MSVYIARNFFSSIMLAIGALTAIAGLVDFLELFRRTAGKDSIPFHIVAEMALLKLPHMLETILIFAVLIGGMLALTKLTRSQELIIVRAAGVSVWQFLLPALALTFALGIFMVAIFNPISAAMISRYEKLDSKYISGAQSLLSISASGLWLREHEAGAIILDQPISEYVLHAKHISQHDMLLHDVTIFAFSNDKNNQDKNFAARIDAKSAKLEKGKWVIYNSISSRPGISQPDKQYITLPTHLNIAQIQDSFAEPRTLSFWQLNSFINTLEKSGFSALRHRVYWHSELASPFLLCGMILIAAVFSLRLPRRGNIGKLMASGALAGFSINFVTNLFHAFGTAGKIPVLLAAWSPAAIAIMAGMALLLHLEDG